MGWNFDDLLTVTFTLFAIIDIVGSIPLLISIKERLGGINELKATLLSGLLMLLFVFLGEQLLRIFGLDVGSFAVGGSIVILYWGWRWCWAWNFLSLMRIRGRARWSRLRFR
jgi:multiple antibiotic resistance protein